MEGVMLSTPCKKKEYPEQFEGDGYTFVRNPYNENLALFSKEERGIFVYLFDHFVFLTHCHVGNAARALPFFEVMTGETCYIVKKKATDMRFQEHFKSFPLHDSQVLSHHAILGHRLDFEIDGEKHTLRLYPSGAVELPDKKENHRLYLNQLSRFL